LDYPKAGVLRHRETGTLISEIELRGKAISGEKTGGTIKDKGIPTGKKTRGRREGRL